MRKLKLSRETLRHLEDRSLQDAPGGMPTGAFTVCCSVTCQITCGNASVCVRTCITCACPQM
jgi:hypothetical protein